MIEYFLPGVCYDEILVSKGFLNKECLSIFLSRLLGVAIMIGSTFVLVPQILKIYLAKSAEGISLLSELLGLLAAFADAAYGYEKGFVLGQWGDSLMISVQTVLIVLQIFWYSNSRYYAAAFFALSSFATLAIFYHFIPMFVLIALQSLSIPIIFASKGVQIVENYNRRGTGQLSLITTLMQFGGSLAKTYVVLRESGLNWLVLIPCVVAAALSGIALFQIIYYNHCETVERRTLSKGDPETAQLMEHV